MAVAMRIKEYLQEMGMPFDVVIHQQTENFLTAAEQSQIPADEVIKAVIVKNREGQPLMAIIPAINQLDFRQLSRWQHQRFHLAKRSDLKGFFSDCSDDAVPVIGQAYEMNVVWDTQIMEMPTIYMEEGDHCGFIHVHKSHFVGLMLSQPHWVFSYTAPMMAS